MGLHARSLSGIRSTVSPPLWRDPCQVDRAPTVRTDYRSLRWARKTGRIDLICHERLHVSVMQRPSGLSKGLLSIWLASGYCGCPPRYLIMLNRWPAGCDNHFQWVMRCSYFEPWLTMTRSLQSAAETEPVPEFGDLACQSFP
jgi:hypothetical protein